MIIRDVSWTAFSIPFRAPFATAHGTLATRDGLLLRLTTDEGLRGLGEASPLPALGGGTTRDAQTIVTALAPRLIGLAPGTIEQTLQQLDLGAPGVAAVACALDTALCDLQAQQAGAPLAALLGVRQYAPTAACPAVAVPVNATVGIAAAAEAARAAAEAVAAGFTCIKLKVGMWASSRAEVERVAAVRDAIGPHVRLRLDANGAWDVATAIAVLREARRHDLELVEQPVAAADLAGLASVRAAAGTPIAADEAASTLHDARQVIAAGAADIVVIKPMTAGGPRPGRAILELARAAGLEAIVTTTLDTGVGVATALHLAAVLPAPGRACGLATGSLLAGDLLAEALTPRNGMMTVPAGPGLGVTLDEAALERFGNSWQHVRR